MLYSINHVDQYNKFMSANKAINRTDCTNTLYSACLQTLKLPITTIPSHQVTTKLMQHITDHYWLTRQYLPWLVDHPYAARLDNTDGHKSNHNLI